MFVRAFPRRRTMEPDSVYLILRDIDRAQLLTSLPPDRDARRCVLVPPPFFLRLQEKPGYRGWPSLRIDRHHRDVARSPRYWHQRGHDLQQHQPGCGYRLRLLIHRFAPFPEIAGFFPRFPPRMHENVLYFMNLAIGVGIQSEIPSGTTFRNLRSARMEESCPDPLPKTAECGPSLPNPPSAPPPPKRCALVRIT